jgi:DNA primase
MSDASTKRLTWEAASTVRHGVPQVSKVTRALDALGIEYLESGENSKAICPMHERITGEPDHNPSWFIHMESGQHICFSCGYKGNLQQLVCDVKELYRSDWGQEGFQYDYNAANEWLATAIEVSIDELREALKKLPTYMGPPPRPLPMAESRLALYTPPTAEALESRNITEESAEQYGILWNPRTYTWILPIRDSETNRLMGWQEKGTLERTFKNRPPGVQKSTTLFGVKTQLEDVAIVLESPLDCLRVHSAGFPGAVATFGAIVSEAQVRLIRASAKVIAAFDNPNIDAAGKKASDQMRAYASKYGINLFFFNYGDSQKKDLGDMTNEEIRWGIENSKSAILGESAYVYGNA